MKAVAAIVALLAIAALAALGGNAPPAAAQQNDDKAALEALYDGANWTNSTNWKTSADLGQWYGVTTNSNGRVTEIRLYQNNLTGTIPTQLSNLSNLIFLVLEGDLPFEASKKYFGKFGIRLSNCGLFTVGDELCNAYQSLGHPNAPVDPETPLGKEQGADELPCGSHETDES